MVKQLKRGDSSRTDQWRWLYSSRQRVPFMKTFSEALLWKPQISHNELHFSIYVSIYGTPWTRFDGIFRYLKKTPTRIAPLFS